jgi:hypothetical protein
VVTVCCAALCRSAFNQAMLSLPALTSICSQVAAPVAIIQACWCCHCCHYCCRCASAGGGVRFFHFGHDGLLWLHVQPRGGACCGGSQGLPHPSPPSGSPAHGTTSGGGSSSRDQRVLAGNLWQPVRCRVCGTNVVPAMYCMRAGGGSVWLHDHATQRVPPFRTGESTV